MALQRKHIHGGLFVIGILVLGTATYFLYRNNKKRYANMIIKANGTSGTLPWLMTLDEGFLKAWAKGLKAGTDTFPYNGKNYNTQGGKAVVVPAPAPKTDTSVASNPISSNPYNLL